MKKRITIEKCQELAESRNGKCLSTDFISLKTLMLWECDKKHQWYASFGNVLYSKSWCKTCSGNSKHTLEECQELAKTKNGECLSKKYINNRNKLNWECENGHTWQAPFYSIKVGHWCPECVINETKDSIEDCQIYANLHGGNCLSEKYISSQDKLNWGCENGHKFTTSFESIKRRKHFCSICYSNENRIKQLNYYIEQAKKLGYKYVSGEYHDASSKLKWLCKDGHTWETQPYVIMRGSNCPECKMKTEFKCRDILQQLTGREFKKSRPKWLKLPESKRPLELDGYCEELNLAFEYDGEYHYMPIVSDEKLRTQKIRDKIKDSICKDRGIILIRIPYWEKHRLEQYISKELIRLEVNFERSEESI